MYPMVPGVFIILQMWKVNVRRTSRAEKGSYLWLQLQWYVLVANDSLSLLNNLHENNAVSGNIQPLFPGVTVKNGKVINDITENHFI